MPLDELRTLIARHARPDLSTPIEGVLLSRVDRPSKPAVSMTGTVVALVAQGAKRLALGDRVYDYGAGQYVVASIDMPIIGQFTEASPSEPALGFGLVLKPAAVAELLLQDSDQARGSVPAAPAIAVSDAGDELIDAVVRLLRLLDSPRDRDVLAPLVIREILWRVITGDQGGTVRQLGLADSGLTQIARAVRWIRENYGRPFRVQDLADASGMSVSAFHRNFQAVTTMSPIRFQKQIRLQEARLLLAAGPADVARVGHRVGYDSPSQFSREYRRQFGSPPGQDAARIRDSTPVAVPSLP
ncbi:AraC family transcriptional regulator [Actinoplanes sp. NPDC051411]|uniref:AraC family transcriptional regulator n=1 Tax=Actinoplanes sp. NPDC051411 TaxID=3155522 RepID=UPI00343770D3